MTEKERQQLLQQLLEKQKTGELKPADRYKIPPQDMPEQDSIKRTGNVSEVATGYTETHARLEAMRCLACKKAPCIKGCPVQIRIQDFIAPIADGDFKKALDIIKENSLLPAVCGRVCPQEVQC
ncbi:MAG: dihydropyrimidine dehydrogenase, partial [Planctomycetota bacterium]